MSTRPSKSDIYLLIFGWIKSVTGLTVIEANQDGPRPARPYASLNFNNPSVALGDVQWQVEQDAGIWVVSSEGMYKAVASINIFGQNAIDTLATLRNSLDRPDIVELFARASVTHLDDGPINDLTALQETMFEERGQMDLTIASVAGSEVDVGTIEHVTMSGSAAGLTVPQTIN